jgi:hypothetical protein
MSLFYKVAGLVVEAAPFGKTTINTIRTGRLGPAEPRQHQSDRPKLSASGSQQRQTGH